MPYEHVSRRNLDELKLRITHENLSFESATDLVREVIDAGVAGQALVHQLVSRYLGGKLPVATDTLINLYEATRSAELLAAMRDKEDAFTLMGIDGKCRLFAAGVTSLEGELIEALWHGWTDPSNPMRRVIVQALAKSGTSAALEALQVINYRLAGDLAEQRVAALPEDRLATLQVESNDAFLSEIRKAENEIRKRSA